MVWAWRSCPIFWADRGRNAGLIATQAISALDFPLAMAVSAIMMATLMGLLYIGHRLFDLTKILSPIN